MFVYIPKLLFQLFVPIVNNGTSEIEIQELKTLHWTGSLGEGDVEKEELMRLRGDSNSGKKSRCAGFFAVLEEKGSGWGLLTPKFLFFEPLIWAKRQKKSQKKERGFKTFFFSRCGKIVPPKSDVGSLIQCWNIKFGSIFFPLFHSLESGIANLGWDLQEHN